MLNRNAHASTYTLKLRAALLLGLSIVSLLLLSAGSASASTKSGTTDTDFGENGRASLGAENGSTDVAVQSDGMLVSSGYSEDSAALARFSRDGTLDGSFGDGGQALLPAEESGRFEAVAVDSQERLVAVGSDRSGAVLVARFLPDGTLDSEFSGNGIARVTVGDNAGAVDVAITDSDEITAVGSFDSSGSKPGSRMFIVRYNKGGGLYPSFANGGIKKFHRGTQAFSVLPGSNGKVTVAGGNEKGATFTRIKQSGKLDPSYGNGGHTLLPIPSGGYVWKNVIATNGSGSTAAAVTLQLPGGHDRDIVLTRLTQKGMIDRGFGRSGTKSIDLSRRDLADDIAVDGSKTVVLSNAVPKHNSSGADFALLRFKSDGTADKSFSGNGRAFGDIGGPTASISVPSALALQGGKYVASGSYAIGSSGGDYLALTRLFG